MALTPTQVAWLAALAETERGGLRAKDDITRGNVWTTKLEVAADWSADTIVASLGYGPDDGGSEANDLSVDVSSFTGGVTTITLQLGSVDTAALPLDSDGDGSYAMIFDIHRTAAAIGSTKYLAFGGWVNVLGSVGNV